jgi:hypothetical protein
MKLSSGLREHPRGMEMWRDEIHGLGKIFHQSAQIGEREKEELAGCNDMED